MSEDAGAPQQIDATTRSCFRTGPLTLLLTSVAVVLEANPLPVQPGFLREARGRYGLSQPFDLFDSFGYNPSISRDVVESFRMVG